MKKVDMIVKAPFFYTMQGEGVGFQSGVAMEWQGGAPFSCCHFW